MPNNNVSIESIAFAISEAYEMLQELSVFADIDGKREFMDIQNKMKMGITLLKAQEPRVMTIEEYKEWRDIPFTERDPVFCEMRTRRGSVTNWDNLPPCAVSEYGKQFRCWTSRPTDEQREAIPWK